MLMWKIVERAEGSVIYIYIYIYTLVANLCNAQESYWV